MYEILFVNGQLQTDISTKHLGYVQEIYCR